MIVLDTSAAVEILRKTSLGDALMLLQLEGECIVAPTLLRVELTNVLWKSALWGDLKKEYMGEVLNQGLSLVDTFVPDEELLLEALREATRLNHSVYDMLYFVLTRRCGGTLLTLDKKLQQLCRDNGVNCIDIDDEF